MKRIATILVALSMALASVASAEFRYGWTISSSSSDPFVNSGSPAPGLLPLYLWLQCSPDGGMSAAEFDLTIPAGVSNFGFTPALNFLNAGGPSDLLLAAGGCPEGPVLAGSWNLFGPASVAGDYCLVPSVRSAQRVTVDCNAIGPQPWPITFKGFNASGGVAACTDVVLCTSPVTATSWGAVKALYR